jgi:prolyl 4-hydroxylase
LTEGELKHLEELILKSKFAKSFVDTDSSDVIYDNTHRTSTFVALEKQGSAKLSGIERKAADLLGVSTVQVEPLQLVRYRRDEFFGIHHDLGTLQDDGSVPMPPKQSFVKRRLATIFCYLNDVENGGCTFFPKCQLRVEPKRGRAVVFCNILETGLPDPKTVHAGERVKQGCKYGLNIWITEE